MMRSWFVGFLSLGLFVATPAFGGWKLAFMGPAGSGKGTVIDELARKYNLPILSASALVKQELADDAELAAFAAALKAKGDLLPDTEPYMGRILKAAVAWMVRHPQGFLIDGIPRTEWQARTLGKLLADKRMALDGAVEVQCGLPMVKIRASGRLQCPGCNVSYHRDLRPPMVPMVCDRCSCELKVRAEDTAEKVEHRWDEYQALRPGIVDYYLREGTFLAMNGELPAEEVVSALVAKLRP